MAPKGKAKAGKTQAKPKVLDYSGLEKGMRVQADWDGSGTFYPAEVVVVADSPKRAKAPVKIHFPGYTDASDCWVGGDCIRSKAIKVKKEPKPEGEKKEREPRKVWMFALTGGPCGGKGSCQKYLREKLEAKGYDVYTCPEGPTIYFNNGALNAFFPGEAPGPNFAGGNLITNLPATKDKLMQFETAILQTQLQMESGFQTMARSTGKKSVIFCDRGVYDIACYLPEQAEGEAWKTLLKKNRQVPIKLLSRYAGVLYLQTAAIGAEKFYKSGDTADDAGNKVFRRETPEEAKELDTNVRKCWNAHKNIIEITNEGVANADAKWEKCLEGVLKTIEASEAPKEASEAPKP